MYAKVFAQIYDGTLCTRGPWEALVTFQQFLVLADMDGVVDMTPAAIARRTTIPLEIIERGIGELVKPDHESRTPTEEGRRLVPLAEGRSWGWRVVNYAHYRELKREEDRREYHRQYWHKRKLKSSTDSTDSTETQHAQQNQPKQKQKQKQKQENIEATPLVVLPSAKRLPACPTDEIVSMYHAKLPMLPRVEVVNDGRRRALSARWRQILTDPDIAKSEKPKEEGVEWFAWYFDHAAKSPFLTGKAKNWRADFDFLINPQKFVKVVEGHYHKEQA